MDNQFLRQFMNMRANLHKKQEKPKETKTMSNPDGITLAHIVENKPPAKEVIDYFKMKCEQLNEEALK